MRCPQAPRRTLSCLRFKAGHTHAALGGHVLAEGSLPSASAPTQLPLVLLGLPPNVRQVNHVGHCLGFIFIFNGVSDFLCPSLSSERQDGTPHHSTLDTCRLTP